VGSVALAGALIVGACGDDETLDTSSTSQSLVQRYEASLTVLESPEHGPQLCREVLTSLPPQCEGLPVVGWDWDAIEGEASDNGTTWGSFHVVGTWDGTRLSLTEPPTSSEPDSDGPSRDFGPACAEPDVVDASQGAAEWEGMSEQFGQIPDVVTAWVSDPNGDWDGPFVGNVIVLPGARDEALSVVREHYRGPVCVVERNGPTEADLAQVQEQLNDDEAQEALGVIQGASGNGQRGVVEAEVWVADAAAVAYAQQRWGDVVELHGILQPVD